MKKFNDHGGISPYQLELDYNRAVIWVYHIQRNIINNYYIESNIRAKRLVLKVGG
jgi:hypothetical protein